MMPSRGGQEIESHSPSGRLTSRELAGLIVDVAPVPGVAGHD